MKIKKYNEGGSIDNLVDYGAGTDVLSGAIQMGMGVRNLRRANKELARAKAAAPSLDTPSQYYENYKNAYDSQLARLESDAIMSNLATSVQALQGAGGRALVGGLGATVGTAQMAQNKMLADERAMRLQAGQQLARAEENALIRKDRRNQNEQQQAMDAANAARQNIAKGATNLATGVMFGGLGQIGDAVKKGAKAAVTGFNNAKDAYQMFMLNRAGDGTPLTIDENTQSFVNSINEKLAIERGQQVYREGAFGQLQRADNIYGLERTPAMPAIVEENIRPDMNAVKRAQVIQNAQNSAIPTQDKSAVTTVTGFAGTGDMTQEQLYRMQTGTYNPTIDFSAPKIDAGGGYMVDNPYYDPKGNKSVSENLFGIKEIYEDGGMMTKGEFNHDKNKVHLIQNGEKIGEATGGEMILNPKQAAAIAKESSYARKLFKKFAANAKKK